MKTKVWRIAATAMLLFAAMGTLLSPANSAAAQAARVDCDGVAEWYSGVDQIQQAVKAAENDPTVAYGTLNPEPYRQAGNALESLDAPKVVSEAHQALETGYATLVSQIEASMVVSQGIGAGQVASFDAQANIVYLVSETRRQLLGGFLGWTEAGVTCGITSAQFTPSENRGCDGVADYMNIAAAQITGFWKFWNDTANRNQTDTSALPLGTGELISGAAFETALTLATTPAPESAMAIQLATVQYVGSLADLYLLNLLAAMGTLYGLDQNGINQIVSQHEQQLALTQQQNDAIQRDWDELAENCDVETRFPLAGDTALTK